MTEKRLKILFFIEGLTDIRFITGLNAICDLTLAVSGPPFRQSLADRITQAGLKVPIDEIPGGRLAFQARSLFYLWRRIRDFDAVISQEVLRGSLNATLIGRLRGVPVITYMGVSPLEYFRCRRERKQIGWLASMAGQFVIWSLVRLNGIFLSEVHSVNTCNKS